MKEVCCGDCRGEKIELQYGKQENGMLENFWWCHDCEKRATLIKKITPITFSNQGSIYPRTYGRSPIADRIWNIDDYEEN